MQRDSAELLRQCLNGYRNLDLDEKPLSEFTKLSLENLGKIMSSLNEKDPHVVYGHNFPGRLAADIVKLNEFYHSRNPKYDLAAIAREEIEDLLPIVEMTVNSVLKS